MKLVLAVASGLALFIVGCADDDSEQASGSPGTTSGLTASPLRPETITSSPTPSVITTGVSDLTEAFREFALAIDEAIDGGDTDFFIERRLETDVTCQEERTFSLCAGQPDGTVVSGIFGSAWMSDAYTYFTPDEFTGNLQRYFAAPIETSSDSFGPGGLRLYALASQASGDYIYQMAITTAIVDIYPSTSYPIGNEEREAHVFVFEYVDDEWRFRREIAAGTFVTSKSWLSGTCVECYDYWELWQE